MQKEPYDLFYAFAEEWIIYILVWW